MARESLNSPTKEIPAKKRYLGRPAWLIINTILIFLATQIVAAFIVTLILSLLHPGFSPTDLFNNSIAGQFFYVMISEAMAAGFVIAIVHRKKLPLARIGLGRKPNIKDLRRAGVGFVIFYGLLILVSVLVNVFLPGVNTSQKQDLGFNNITTTGDNVLTFFALVILPPFGEEPLLRGYLFSGLRERWRFRTAAIVTSLIFGIAHLEFGSGAPLLWAAGIDTFVLSLVLVYLRETTGALYAGILVHMLNNLVAFAVQIK